MKEREYAVTAIKFFNEIFDSLQEKISRGDVSGVIYEIIATAELVVQYEPIPLPLFHHLVMNVHTHIYTSNKGFKIYTEQTTAPFSFLQKSTIRIGGLRAADYAEKILEDTDKALGWKRHDLHRYYFGSIQVSSPLPSVGTPFAKNWNIHPPNRHN